MLGSSFAIAAVCCIPAWVAVAAVVFVILVSIVVIILVGIVVVVAVVVAVNYCDYSRLAITRILIKCLCRRSLSRRRLYIAQLIDVIDVISQA